MQRSVDKQHTGATAVREETRRVLTICNACRYCEGLCATFQAMTQRRVFSDWDLDYLANLCHNCTACYFGCQYAPPHAFNVNVPRALTELRVESYQRYARPHFIAQLFERNGLVITLVTALSLALVIVLTLALREPETLYAAHAGAGAFYAIIGHGVMAAVAGMTLGFAVLAIAVGCRGFWRASGEAVRPGFAACVDALRDSLTLRNLGGGHGKGCSTHEQGRSNARRVFHQFTMLGFVACFAATVVAAVYDYGFGRAAPYPLHSIPVVLGTLGGVGLLVGPAGLLWVKLQADHRPMTVRHYGMDYAFLATLFLISLTGLALLALRETSAMGVLLAVHLGFVLAFFVALPYSKFVHAVYRFAALLRFAQDNRN